MPAEQIIAAARMYADGPSTFVSGHGIDAFSAGVQTFRAYHCLVAISGNVDRPGGNLRVRTPKGFRNYGDLLHMPQFRLDEATEMRTIGSDKLPAVGRPKGLADGLPQPLRDRGHADRQALPRARTLCQRGQHSRYLSEHAAQHRGAALARFRGSGSDIP